MPVLDPGGDVYHIAGVEFLSLFAPLLIVAPAGHADQNLTAALVRLVDVPVVAAARLKGHVVHPNLAGGEGVEIALPHKILGKAVVGSADGEDHLLLVLCFAICPGVLCPDLLGHAEGRPDLGPAGIKSGVGQDFRDLLSGDAVLLGGG